MRHYFTFAALLLICAVSCKKDAGVPVTENEPTPAPAANGYPLTIGTYWIYENTTIDTNGVETVSVSNPTDSCYIVDDTVLGGNTYMVFVGNIINENAVYFRRDSAGFIVDQNGKIYYSKTDLVNTLRTESMPGMYDAFYKMAGPMTTISVPAGAYACYDFQGMFILPASYPWDNPRYYHSYYANGVGLVRETTFFYSSPDYISRRLVRYHVQ
jgi:hypothetical protein